jgi:hypothetical protein
MGILSKFLGSPVSGLLSKEQRQGAEQRALQDFGLAMLAAGDPSAGPGGAPGFGKALAMGVMAGRESFDRFARDAETVETRQKQEAIFAEGLSLPALENAAAEALRAGDLATVQAVTPLIREMRANAAFAAEAAAPVDFQILKGDNEYLVFEPGNPRPIETIPFAAEDGDRLHFVTHGNTVSAFDAFTGDMIAQTQLTPGQALDKDTVSAIQAAHRSFDQDAQVKRIREVPEQFDRIMSTSNAFLDTLDANGESTADTAQQLLMGQAMTSAFARLLDPGSVVRNEETKRLEIAGSVPARIRAMLEKMESGLMTEEIVRAFVFESKNQVEAQVDRWNSIVNTHQERLTKIGIDPSLSQFGPVTGNPATTALDRQAIREEERRRALAAPPGDSNKVRNALGGS